MTRLHPDLLELEDHGASYSGNGRLSHVIFPGGSVASIPQKADALVRAVAAARLEMVGV